MIKYNFLKANGFGGGNSEGSELASGFRALTIRRLPSFSQAMTVALFVFLSTCALSSCSGDNAEENAPSAPDYQALLTAHEWKVASASQSLGGLFFDVKETDTYCRFSADSVWFSEGAITYEFDDDGNLTQGKYQVTPVARLPYDIKDGKIQIDTQKFTITDNKQGTDLSLAIANEHWKFVLKKK